MAHVVAGDGGGLEPEADVWQPVNHKNAPKDVCKLNNHLHSCVESQ